MKALFCVTAAYLGVVAISTWEARPDLPSPCQAIPAEARLPPGGSHVGLAGRYDLSVISEGPNLAGRRALGTLWLWPSASTDSSPKAGKHVPPNDTVEHPYFGATDLNLWDMTRSGASDEKSLRTRTDPVYPQVLVEVRGWPTGTYSKWKEVSLWIESVANVRDGTVGLDGAGFILDAAQIDSGGFAGRWGPAGIVGTEKGYFCASRSRRGR
jgi:hypothetical protein